MAAEHLRSIAPDRRIIEQPYMMSYYTEAILRKHSSLFDMIVPRITVETATSDSRPVHAHMAAVQMLA